MNTRKEDSFPLPGSTIQAGRTAFHEKLIDAKIGEISEITDKILRWPVPRPILKQRLNKMLGTLAWSGRELTESLKQDKRIQAVSDLAKQMVADASHTTAAAASSEPGPTPELVGASEPLGYNAAAEASFAIVDDSRLPRGDSTDLIA